MKKVLAILLLLALVAWQGQSLRAAERPSDAETGRKAGRSPSHLAKTNQTAVNQTLINIGQVASWIYSDGRSAIEPGGNSGFYFPRGQRLTSAVFQDGLVWGGKVNDGGIQLVRVGGQTFRIGTVPGAIVSQGVGEDLNDQLNVDRVWRIRRDFATADLQLDAAEVFLATTSSVTQGEIDAVRAQYAADWLEWPVYKGAPFYDVDGDGQYNPQINADGSPKLRPGTGEAYDPAKHADEPGVAGADQVVWLIVNDLNSANVGNMYGSNPIGLELQLTMWGYRRADALGNIIFKQFRVIYKGTATTSPVATVDSMYFCQWSDIDLGQAGDDLAGSDTSLSLGYVYNAVSTDGNYSQFRLPPPASGYDFFAGPLVADPNGEAIFGLKKRPGFRNLPMSTFAFFVGGGTDQDPPLGSYNGSLQWWNLLRGFRPAPENPPSPWIDPTTNQVTKFRVPGDPVTGEGWLDPQPGDHRILLASGPFTLALGDTQETVVAALAGLGSDRLSSISVLKFTDRYAQEAFDNLFELPSPPASPASEASEFDGQILLNWGEDIEAITKTETIVEKGYAFEGYNIYQLPSAGAGLDQATKLATFDLVNEVTTIAQETFDEASGLVLELPVQIGKNTGLLRTFTVTQDRLRDRGLVNGQTYFFAVTAYNYNGTDGLTTKTLESSPVILTVVPQTAKPGVRYQAAIGDTLPGVVHSGSSDGSVVVLATDPSQVEDASYKVVFVDDGHGGTLWHLLNTTNGDTLLKDQTNQSGDDTYFIKEGLQVKVFGPALDFRDIAVVANGNGPHAPLVGADWYRHAELYEPSQAKGGWFFLIAGGADILDYASAVGRWTRNGTLFPVAIPNDYEIRFTAAGGMGWNAFTDGSVTAVPFEIWNIGSSTPDDPSDDVRMIPYINDDDLDGRFSFKLDHQASGGNDDPYSDWIYFMMPQNDTPGQAGYQQFADSAATGSYNGGVPASEHLARVVIMHWNISSPGGNPGAGNVAEFPESGTVFRIVTTKPNTPADVYTFSTSGSQVTQSAEAAKADLSLVNVFPNPYLGFNRAELNRFNRFMTFSHLPRRATIRIFNLAGVLVRTITKEDDSQFTNWDLLNERGLPAASGIYVAHIQFPDLSEVKILKLALVREDPVLPNF
ncbi:MAG: hypothetical protein ACREOO_03495 [bacterium]